MLLELAQAQTVQVNTCPPVEKRERKTADASCPETIPHHTVADAGNYTSPVEVLAGCPFGVTMNFNEHLYFKVARNQPGLRITHDWDYMEGSTNPVFYAFTQVPFYRGGDDSYYEEYFWPSSNMDDYVLEQDSVSKHDIYHCSRTQCSAFCGEAIGAVDACVGDAYPMENTGFLYVTMVGLSTGLAKAVHVMHVYNVTDVIREEQLQAVKDLFYQTCYPTQHLIPTFPTNQPWRKAEHVEGHYSVLGTWPWKEQFSTNGGERDMDRLPYCDWMFGVNLESLGAEAKCSDIPDIECDQDGYVVALRLSERGLRGHLPASFASMNRLQEVYLNRNQLMGEFPQSLFASNQLKDLQISHNFFAGTIPCPTHPEPNLEVLLLAQNSFTGTLPTCLFTDAPYLQQLNVNYNKLDSKIPPEIKYATNLVTLSADHTGLHGSLPVELECMNRLSFLHLQRNNLTGTVPQRVVDGLVDMYSLRLSFNELSGTVPHFDTRHSSLQILYLDHNQFDGNFGEQLSEFANAQRAVGVVSEVMLGHNNLHGPLPSVFYNLVNNAFRITELDAVGNHFVCDKDTNDWPAWVFRTGSSFFGKCVPIATPTHFSNVSSEVNGGNPPLVAIQGFQNHSHADALQVYMFAESELVVHGRNFRASDELKCRFGESTEVPALYKNAEQMICKLPRELEIGKAYMFSVANYGSDYWSRETSNEFVPVNVMVVAQRTSRSGFATWLIALIAVACLLAVSATTFAAVLVMKELKGEPLFHRIEDLDELGSSEERDGKPDMNNETSTIPRMEANDNL